MIMVVFSTNFTMLFIGIFLFGVSAGMYFPSASAILSASVPVTWVGTAMGIFGLLEDVGWMIGPAVGGLLLNYWPIQSPFVFAAIVATLGLPLYLVGKRRGYL
jgi:MFS family permease